MLVQILRSFAAGMGTLLLGMTAYGQGAAPVVSCESLGQMALSNTTITMAKTVEAGTFEAPKGFQPPSNVQPASPGAPGGAAPSSAQGGPPPSGSPAGPPPGGPGSDVKSLPAFCRIAATLSFASDSVIKIEVWMPLSNWNEKLYGIGSGGTAGDIKYQGLGDAIRQGYAGVTTDAGHDAFTDNGKLGFVIGHPERLKDYAYRANHEMTVKAKALITAFYGVGPKHAIFSGCSLGSMQAINEAGRFPEDYDGVIAGALMNPIARFNAAQIWPAILVLKDPAKKLTTEKIAMIHEAALKACATPVSEHDGALEEPDRCHFDPAILLCKGDDAPNCLTAPQIEGVKQVYAGPVNPRTGEKIFVGPAPGAEGGFAQLTGSRPSYAAIEIFQNVVHQDPNWDWKTMDFDNDIALADKVLGPLMYVTPEQLKPFFARGGKLMLYDGWIDYHNPENVRLFYQDLQKTVGPQVKDSIRIFNVPGMGHCGGGVGCDTFDKVGTMSQWQDTGKAPEQINGSKVVGGKVVRTRPLCAYPKMARYKGTGDMDDTTNFVCAEKQLAGK
jgi:feruloyl esterase